MPRGDDFVDQAKKLVQFDVEEGFREALSSRGDAPFAFGLHDSELNDETTFAGLVQVARAALPTAEAAA